MAGAKDSLLPGKLSIPLAGGEGSEDQDKENGQEKEATRATAIQQDAGAGQPEAKLAATLEGSEPRSAVLDYRAALSWEVQWPHLAAASGTSI
jgi:hypothetical protein